MAYGLVLHPGAYLRVGWNQLDAFIVSTSLAALYTQNSKLSMFKILRLLRALRPLRMINRFKVGRRTAQAAHHEDATVLCVTHAPQLYWKHSGSSVAAYRAWRLVHSALQSGLVLHDSFSCSRVLHHMM